MQRNISSKAELQKDELPFWMALRGARLDGYNTQVEFEDSDRLVHIENSARPLKGANHEIEGAVLVMRDVSSRVELESIVEENFTAIKHKNTRLEHFLTKLSFNLLGPTSNLNILYSLLERSQDLDERESYINKIGEVAKMLQYTVGNINSAVVAYTASHDEWGVNRFESTVESFVANHYANLKGKGLTFSCNFERAREVAYPAEQFDTIITNLLENILQLCPTGTSEVWLKTFKKNESVGLKIKSNIIDQRFEDLESILVHPSEMFLGFVKAKELVEALGGRVIIGKEQIQIIF